MRNFDQWRGVGLNEAWNGLGKGLKRGRKVGETGQLPKMEGSVEAVRIKTTKNFVALWTLPVSFRPLRQGEYQLSWCLGGG